MTCKDCVHYDACINILKKTFKGITQEEIDRVSNRDNDCRTFKPKADFVEVVRCKDCKYYEGNSCFNRQWDLESSVEIPLVRPTDFCSYGERKEGDNGL